MDEYKRANGDIRAPEGLKERAAGGERRRPGARWYAAVAAALAVTVALTAVLWPAGNSAALAIYEAEYPQTAAYPKEPRSQSEAAWEQFNEDWDAWLEDSRGRRQRGVELMPEGYDDFVAGSAARFLTDTGGENAVYSPLSAYMALAMLAELTDGESRNQLLGALGAESLEELRTGANALWEGVYSDDGMLTTIPASSVWIDAGHELNGGPLETLAESYYASSYQGEMGSPELDGALADWIDAQTGGLLSEQAREIQLSPETVIALVNTLYFSGKWTGEFKESATEPGMFHSPGGDVEAQFMHKSSARNYFWGEDFAAVGLGFENGAEMWLLLPDEGVSAEELVESGAAADFVEQGWGWPDSKYLIVNMAVPRFDVESTMDLAEGLRALGVEDVFDIRSADFSPLTEEALFVSAVKHSARVTVDEEGCTAAALTVIQAPGAAMPPDDEVDFVLDRPFVFAITSETGAVLFMGVVNTP